MNLAYESGLDISFLTASAASSIPNPSKIYNKLSMDASSSSSNQICNKFFALSVGVGFSLVKNSISSSLKPKNNYIRR